MFTGIIEAIGEVVSLRRGREGARIRVRGLPAGDPIAEGESVAVNGCCLTVARRGRGWFEADCSPQTLRLTTLGDLRTGSPVNLERALTPSARMGGHFVQGHVDAVGVVLGSRREGNSRVTAFRPGGDVGSYLVPRGSVAVDGVSLTVSALTVEGFEVTLIPHTLELTNLGRLRKGSRVNLEADILGKYVRSFLEILRPDGDPVVR
jgi:riboflavin synthase